MSTGPFDIDTDPHLRIINGSTNRYVIGLSWHLAGLTNGDLPPRPGWDWGLSYDRNVETDHRPSDALLAAGRIGSTLFLAFSVAVMFGIGWQMGGRLLAYLVSGLYALHPTILLNGRRAMMEGSMLFFGLLTILLAIIISRKRAEGGRGLWGWWLALTLAAGLALVSKHTSIVFVGAALGWIFVAEILRRRWLGLAITTLKLLVSGVLVVAIFIALSPALWYDTGARLQDLIRLRGELLDIQVNSDPLAPMTLDQRISQIITQPFIEPPMHFEVANWADAETITREIQRYMASPLSGLQFGPVLGGALSVMVLVGLVVLVGQGRTFRLGVFVWLVFTLAFLLINPLPWQRYYLPLIPLTTLLAGVGISRVLALIVHRPEQESHLPAAAITPKL
jgi:4-amino-4-deoxy-L-arabinose transferase-like glycosyltransferase